MSPHEPGEGGTLAGADPPDEFGIVEPSRMAFGGAARPRRAPHQRRPMLSVFAMGRHGKAQNVITWYPSWTSRRTLGWPSYSPASWTPCATTASFTPNAPAQ